MSLQKAEHSRYAWLGSSVAVAAVCGAAQLAAEQSAVHFLGISLSIGFAIYALTSGLLDTPANGKRPSVSPRSPKMRPSATSAAATTSPKLLSGGISPLSPDLHHISLSAKLLPVTKGKEDNTSTQCSLSEAASSSVPPAEEEDFPEIVLDSNPVLYFRGAQKSLRIMRKHSTDALREETDVPESGLVASATPVPDDLSSKPVVDAQAAEEIANVDEASENCEATVAEAANDNVKLDETVVAAFGAQAEEEKEARIEKSSESSDIMVETSTHGSLQELPKTEVPVEELPKTEVPVEEMPPAASSWSYRGHIRGGGNDSTSTWSSWSTWAPSAETMERLNGAASSFSEVAGSWLGYGEPSSPDQTPSLDSDADWNAALEALANSVKPEAKSNLHPSSSLDSESADYLCTCAG